MEMFALNWRKLRCLKALNSTKTLWTLMLVSILIFIWTFYNLQRRLAHPHVSQILRFGTETQNAFKFYTMFSSYFTHDLKFYKYPHRRNSFSENVTLVTAFFNIGAFQKGKVGIYNSSTYSKEAAKFAGVKNYVVLYSDDEKYIKLFESHRKDLKNRTESVLLDRRKLWSFSQRDKIAKIYLNPYYPKHHPNTVIPEYSCSMNAKYEVVSMAINENYFKTSYFAWIDQGYFREFKTEGERFTIGLPPGFDNRTVCFGEIFKMSDLGSVENIFRTNNIWISGGFFLAHYEVMKTFIDQFKLNLFKYLGNGLSSSDQQILYAMYWQDFIKNRDKGVDLHPQPLQVYLTTLHPGDPWFLLGKISIVEKYYVDLVKR